MKKMKKELFLRKVSVLLGLLMFTSLTAFSKSQTPFQYFCSLWQEQINDSTELTLLTEVPMETLNKISPFLLKEFKIKNDIQYDTPTNVGGILTTLMKEKYGNKSNAKNDFLSIQYSTKSVDFENYLKNYPDSKYAEEAKARMACFTENDLLEAAAKDKQRSSYEAFANFCHNNSLCNFDGCETISQKSHASADAITDWYALVDRSNGRNPEIYNDYSDYLLKHGLTSVFSAQASDSMKVNKDRYDWNTAKRLDNINAYQEYMTKHSDGRFVWSAEQVIKELELWDKAKTSDKYEDYCAYYKEFPDGRFVQEAIKKMKEEEEPLWKEISGREVWPSLRNGLPNPELAAYEAFVTKYPSGYYASEAQNKITELRLAPYLKDAPTLSSIQAVGVYSHPGYSLVCFGNVDKSKTITVSITGPTGFSKHIKPGKWEWVKVKNGTYKVLVQASEVENWWGTADFQDRLYADGWSTVTTFNGIRLGSNKDEAALNRLLTEVKEKIEEEELNTLRYILNGE